MKDPLRVKRSAETIKGKRKSGGRLANKGVVIGGRKENSKKSLRSAGATLPEKFARFQDHP